MGNSLAERLVTLIDPAGCPLFETIHEATLVADAVRAFVAEAQREPLALLRLIVTEALGNLDDGWASVPTAYVMEAMRLTADGAAEDAERARQVQRWLVTPHVHAFAFASNATAGELPPDDALCVRDACRVRYGDLRAVAGAGKERGDDQR